MLLVRGSFVPLFMPSSQGLRSSPSILQLTRFPLLASCCLILDSSRLRKGLLMSGEMLAEPALQPLGLGFSLPESTACKMDFFIYFFLTKILKQEGFCVSLKERQSCSLPYYLINALQTESSLV